MTFLVWECYGSPEKHENSLKFVKIRVEECFDKVLNEEFFKKLMCKMKNVITRIYWCTMFIYDNWTST
jgi:myosin-crossreactive antigen